MSWFYRMLETQGPKSGPLSAVSCRVSWKLRMNNRGRCSALINSKIRAGVPVSLTSGRLSLRLHRLDAFGGVVARVVDGWGDGDSFHLVGGVGLQKTLGVFPVEPQAIAV